MTALSLKERKPVEALRLFCEKNSNDLTSIRDVVFYEMLHLFRVNTGSSRPLCRELSRQQGCRPIGTVRNHTYSGDSRHGSPTAFREYTQRINCLTWPEDFYEVGSICIYIYIYRL